MGPATRLANVQELSSPRLYILTNIKSPLKKVLHAYSSFHFQFITAIMTSILGIFWEFTGS